MPLPKTVTAQDFIKALQRESGRLIRNGEFFLSNIIIGEFDALLSRVRKEAFQEGRKQGLKEMDEIWSQMHFAKTSEWLDAHRDWDYDGGNLWKLRQEYQQPN